MSDIMDDWFGFDPPPPVPKAADPARPAPTRRTATSNVVTGVDATREFGSASVGGSTRTSRTLLVEDEADSLGVGINV